MGLKYTSVHVPDGKTFSREYDNQICTGELEFLRLILSWSRSNPANWLYFESHDDRTHNLKEDYKVLPKKSNIHRA